MSIRDHQLGTYSGTGQGSGSANPELLPVTKAMLPFSVPDPEVEPLRSDVEGVISQAGEVHESLPDMAP